MGEEEKEDDEEKEKDENGDDDENKDGDEDEEKPLGFPPRLLSVRPLLLRQKSGSQPCSQQYRYGGKNLPLQQFVFACLYDFQCSSSKTTRSAIE